VTERRHESGAALLVAVLLLALMGVIGLSSMETVMRDRQIAGYQKRSQTALYAAEAGVAVAMGMIRKDAADLAGGGEGALLDYNPSAPDPPLFPEEDDPQMLGSDFPAPGSPSFYMDPDASDPDDPSADPQAIRYIGKGDVCPGWVMSSDVASVEWAEALWDIRVRGENPGGTVVSIQAMGTNCHPYN
jgi:hypothetical protein